MSVKICDNDTGLTMTPVVGNCDSVLKLKLMVVLFKLFRFVQMQ
jgi:hypothetical protein